MSNNYKTKPEPKQPADYHPEEDLYGYEDKPSPTPTVIAIASALLIAIAMAASELFK